MLKRISTLLVIISIGTGLSAHDFFDKLSDTAIELTKDRVVYDPPYFVIDYPGGDILYVLCLTPFAVCSMSLTDCLLPFDILFLFLVFTK